MDVAVRRQTGCKAAYLLAQLAIASPILGCREAETETNQGGAAVQSGRVADASPQGVVDAERAASDVLCEADLGSTTPVHAVGDVYLAGQPSREDLAELKARGIATVVSLRKPGELEWDEAAAVRQAGMEFVAVPFDGPDELTDDVFQRIREVLRENKDRPLVLHCGRANRVGAVWMAYRALDAGLDVEAALREAEAVGLRTPEYATKAKEFIRRQQAAVAGAQATADEKDR